MLKRRECEKLDQKEPEQRKAAIYLREPGPDDTDRSANVPPIDVQCALCRRAAAAADAENVGEWTVPSRPGLREVLEMADQHRLDLVIVASLDCLAGNVNEAFDIALRLYLTGTIAVPADMGYEFPWTAAAVRHA
jgi:DNA invertase Pin-like site-specific DNA recombinase